MTAPELRRKLLFYGFTDITDFLTNSPLNRYLYKNMLDYREICNIETPMIKLFNEIYYQCVRVNFDINPGEDLSSRYINESAWWFRSKIAAEMVFFFVWAIFKNKRKLSFAEECFVEHLNPLVLHSDNKEMLEELVMDMRAKDIKVPDQFAPMIYPVVKAIPIQTKFDTEFTNRIDRFISRFSLKDNYYYPQANCWMELTDNYSHPMVEKYVKLYSDVDNRLSLLFRIESSCPKRLYKKHKEFFNGFRMHIESGQVVYQVICEDEIDSRHEWIEVEQLGMSEHINIYSNELKNIAEQYKQERDEARKQNEEQRKTYEMQMTRLEAKYESAVKELEATTKEIAAAEEKPQELVLAVNEMATHVMERFSKPAAEEFITMFYRLSLKHGNLDESVCNMIDRIIPTILQRGGTHQTFNFERDVHQMNLNTQVENKYNEKKPQK